MKKSDEREIVYLVFRFFNDNSERDDDETLSVEVKMGYTIFKTAESAVEYAEKLSLKRERSTEIRIRKARVNK